MSEEQMTREQILKELDSLDGAKVVEEIEYLVIDAMYSFDLSMFTDKALLDVLNVLKGA